MEKPCYVPGLDLFGQACKGTFSLLFSTFQPDRASLSLIADIVKDLKVCRIYVKLFGDCLERENA